MKLDQLRC